MKKICLVILLLLSTGCSSLLYFPSKKQHFDPIALKITHEEVYFHSEDNVRLHGWYMPADKPKGLIVFFHGNGENLSTHFMSMAWIIQHGYEVFIFDYRGYGKSRGETSPKGTVLDGKAALRWADARRLEKKMKRPPIVLGQSLGGAVAMRSVYEVKNEVPVSLLIAESTFHSYQSVARRALSKSWLFWSFQWLPYLVISDSWSPEDIIGDISPIPMLVVHGDKDPVVNIELGREVFKRAKEPKKFWAVPGGRHIDTFWRHKGLYQKKLLKELQE